MNSLLIGLLAETPAHPGAGQSADIIDLPVAREAATGYPVIPGSGFKGALADYARDLKLDPEKAKRIFGEQETAGALLVADVRLLLLPVRSLHSAYKWVTCPHLLERWQRDAERAGNAANPPPATGNYHGAGEGDLFLEERQFTKATSGDVDVVKIAEAIKPLIKHESTCDRLAAQLVVISDDDFTWFAKNGLGVQARNVLDENTKESNNLWYEEYIPADALFYAVLAERQTGILDTVKSLFEKQPYIQLGGNETVGQGWFALSVLKKGGQDANA